MAAQAEFKKWCIGDSNIIAYKKMFIFSVIQHMTTK